MTNTSGEVQFFLIHLEKDKIESFFTKLLSSGVGIELLDPRELGPKWQDISFIEPIVIQSNSENTLKMRQIDQVIGDYAKIYSFEEKYETGDIDKVLENWQEKYLLDAVQKLNNNSIINKKFLQQKSILKKVKNKWEVTIIKDLKAFYTKCEIAFKLPLIQKKLFKVDKHSEVIFACFAVINRDLGRVTETLIDQEIDYEITSWTIQITPKNTTKYLVYNILSEGVSQRLSKIFVFIYYFLGAFVIHDIFVGIIIVITTLCAYRFELEDRTFLSQVWIGLGAIIFGVIGGSFAGNMLQVLSMSKYFFVKETCNFILSLLSLFQVVDWTNQNQNLLLNYNLVNHNITPLAIFTIVFTVIASLILIISQLMQALKDYNSYLLKKSIVRVVFVITLSLWILVILNLLPLWCALISSFGLLLYQPNLQILEKIKTFFVGEFGFFGAIKLFIRSLWFVSVFGFLVLSTLIFNFINSAIGDNIIILFILNVIISIILWQVTAFLVGKALKVNLIDQIANASDTLLKRNFEPISKYKYWKF